MFCLLEMWLTLWRWHDYLMNETQTHQKKKKGIDNLPNSFGFIQYVQLKTQKPISLQGFTTWRKAVCKWFQSISICVGAARVLNWNPSVNYIAMCLKQKDMQSILRHVA